MQNMTEFISRYCNYNKKVIRTTAYLKVIQRLSFWLLTSMDANKTYHLPGTQGVLADILQTNRSSLNQELRKLEKMNAIVINKRQIKIIDSGILEDIINE